MPDATRLFIQPTRAIHLLAQRFAIHQLVNNVPQRVNLCGFSFFDEVGGLDLNSLPPGVQGIDLRGPGDAAPNPPPVPPRYSMTFVEYLNKLRAARINWVRVFIFHGYKVRAYPFAGSFGTGFRLEVINQDYIARLVDFVKKARERGIVVCISLFTSQAFDEDGLRDDPFHSDNNKNGVIVKEKGVAVSDGRLYFCDIEQPPGDTKSYNPRWPQKQKLWWIQRNLVHSVVNATKDYWNVAYELMNEPSAGITGVVPWCVTVAKWLNELLHDPVAKRRSRLVVVNAGDNLIENADPALRLLDHLNPPGLPLYDVFSLHGGGGNLPSQWGGPHGVGRSRVCNSTQAPDAEQILRGADETLASGRVVHHRGILDAIRRINSHPGRAALIFDTDSQYWAQKNVTPYVEAVLGVGGNYSYRWGDTFLSAVNDVNCAKLQPLRLGLDQRLAKIAAASNRDTVTVFQ